MDVFSSETHLTSAPHDDWLDTATACPVTGLSVRSRPEWTDRHFGGAYRLTTRVIGDRILLNQPSGVADLNEIVESLDLTDAVIREHIDASAGYVHLSDYSGMHGISRDARKHYGRTMEQQASLVGLIYFNVTPHVASVARLRETVHRMIGLDQGFTVMITGTTHTHATDRKARRLLMASVKQWHRRPVQLTATMTIRIRISSVIDAKTPKYDRSVGDR